MSKILVFITVITLLLTGCPTKKILPIKPEKNTNDPVSTEQEIPKRVVESYDPRNLSFPVTTDKKVLSNRQSLTIIDLAMPISYYWKTAGEFPISIKKWVQSGYPLTWPRDVMRGTPVKVANLDNVEPVEEMFGSFQYTKTDEGKVEIKYIVFDPKRAQETGKDEWKITGYILPDKYNKDYELPFALVNGSKKNFNEITDPEKQKLYLYCAELGYLLHMHTGWLFVKEEMLPSSISDLLFSFDYIIRENFQAFAHLLESSNAVLKFGIDHDKRIQYFYFSMDNEVYIFSCIEYGYDQYALRIINYDEIDNLNMSSPLLTNDNISSLDIPEQYMISIKDIPFGD